MSYRDTADSPVNLQTYCDVFGVPLQVWRDNETTNRAKYYICDCEQNILDFFTVSEYAEITRDVCRQVNGRFVINW